jgi:hypothetical protein
VNALNSPGTSPGPSSGTVCLDTDEAESLADTLGFVDDWLRRAHYETLADLADYIDSTTLPGAVRDVADVFIIRLGWHELTLRRRIKQTTKQTGKQVDR